MNKINLYYEVAHSQLQEQDRRNGEFGGKAVGIMGVSASLLGINALVLRLSAPGAQGLSAIEIGVGVALLLSFLATFTLCLSVVRTRSWLRSPRLKDFAHHLRDYEDEALTEWIGDQYRRSVEHNEGILSRKADLLSWGLGLLASSTLLTALLAALLHGLA